MNREEFIKLIKYIGFILESNLAYHRYYYKNYEINLYDYIYNFYNGSEWIKSDLNDLSPFKKELRSIKLKGLLR